MSVCQNCGADLDQRATGRKRKWCSERCRRVQYDQPEPCVDCGAPTSSSRRNGLRAEPRCYRCGTGALNAQRHAERVARRREIERRWLAGETLPGIAAALDSTVHAIGAAISGMRAEGGYDLPYRNPGSAAWQRAHPEAITHARETRLGRVAA